MRARPDPARPRLVVHPGGRRSRRVAAIAAFSLALVTGGPALIAPGAGTGIARASILMALDLPDLVQQSEHIAVVEVTSVHAAWDERHERIYSTIELKVMESWKAGAAEAGNPVDHLTIVQPGGTVGDISMTVTGLGTFAAGERSLVFLRGPANHAQVVGMTQGKRPLRFEATSKRWLVSPPDLRSATLVKPPAKLPVTTPAKTTTPPVQAPVPARPAVVAATPTDTARTVPARDLPLDELRTEVRKLLGTRAP
jgi:hypothetical protein